jgi:hypothetical protein
MPQSTKDSSGGKEHAKKKTHDSGAASGAQAKKPSSGTGPVGPAKHGEKKTTP